jgi:uncharacterized membrane protein
MGFWKTVLAVFVGVLLYEVVDNLFEILTRYLMST